ncbi:hypothetical protein Acid345_1142 [Candidatus Koribacter versatilis Ellin345]|uniref:eCIS core domain-containing protein n=1 Tax=Koribacter versatilis (strain Ellin345) TaxID=204669 RepID=Q1ISK5_KORVE|nr:DUF4157 domain-containing protein [Candidatus Koribacter versatilis]ABF40145.1 hypothetical protein Acid345_1142 [Candidatus Koribacter versatilis Ellin345]
MLTRARLTKEAAPTKAATPAKKATNYYSQETQREGVSAEYSFSLAGLRLFSGAQDDGSSNSEDFSPLLPIQAKLDVGEVDDPLEAEADRTADAVMKSPSPAPPTSPAAHSSEQKKCECGGTCEKCRGQQQPEPVKLQRKPAAAGSLRLAAAPPIVHEVLRSAGQPLDPQTRSFFEPRFGYDFSRIRVHRDAQAAESAEALHAKAYTVGRDIVFSGRAPSSDGPEARTLMAHELTHVVQQNVGSVVLRRSPDKRWKTDVSAAKYRGQVMSARIRRHGKLSQEAREKVNSELAFFEGAAKDAYLKEVKPALHEVVEIEMPEMNMARPIHPPKPMTLMPLNEDPNICGPGGCKSDEDLGIAPPAPVDPVKQEFELRKELNLGDLDTEMVGWSEADQKFARELVTQLLDQRIRPENMPSAIRGPVLERYLEWMKLVDAERHKQCDPNRGGIATARATASNDDPCKSWFSPESGHAENELQSLERTLKLTVKADRNATPSQEVYWSVFEYRKLTDPKMLESAQIAGEMVGGLVAFVDLVNVTMASYPVKLGENPTISTPPRLSGTTQVDPPVTPKVPAKTVVPDPPTPPKVPAKTVVPDPPTTPTTAPKVVDPPNVSGKVADADAAAATAKKQTPPPTRTTGIDDDAALGSKGSAKGAPKGKKTAADNKPTDKQMVSTKDKGKTAPTKASKDDLDDSSAQTKGSKSDDATGDTKTKPDKRKKVPPPEKKPPKDTTPPVTRSGPMSPSEERVRNIAGKDIYVGMRARIKMKGGKVITKGLRNTRFDPVDPARAQAIGGKDPRAAQLPEVTVPSYAGAKKGSQKSSGFVIQPAEGADSLEVVAWNSGDPLRESNISHAERQFIDWFRGQDAGWTNQVESVEVEVFGRDICTNCESDISDLKRGYDKVKFKWDRTDTGRPYKPENPNPPTK